MGGLGAARGGSALRRGDRRERLQHPQHNSTRGSYPVGLRVTERRSGGERRRRSGRARPHPGAARGGCASACRGGLQGRLHLPRNERPSSPPPGGGPRRANKSPPRRPAGASSPSPQRVRSCPPPGLCNSRPSGVQEEDRSRPPPPTGGRQSRAARAPPRTPGGSRGDPSCPPPPGGAKRRPAGASTPSPQREAEPAPTRGRPAAVRKRLPRRPTGASSPSPQRERSSPPPGQPAIGGTRGVPVTPASPYGGEAKPRPTGARAPPNAGGVKRRPDVPAPPRGGAKWGPAGASSPSPQRDEFSLMEAAQRQRRHKPAGEPSRTKPALRWRHHPSPPRPGRRHHPSPLRPAPADSSGLSPSPEGQPQHVSCSERTRLTLSSEPPLTRPPGRRHHPSPLRPAPAASSFTAAPRASGIILPCCAQRQQAYYHQPGRPGAAGDFSSQPCSQRAASSGRIKLRPAPSPSAARGTPPAAAPPRPYFFIYFLDPFFIFVSHSFVLYRLLIQGPKV